MPCNDSKKTFVLNFNIQEMEIPYVKQNPFSFVFEQNLNVIKKGFVGHLLWIIFRIFLFPNSKSTLFLKQWFFGNILS